MNSLCFKGCGRTQKKRETAANYPI